MKANKTNYFFGCETAEELKKEYHKLSRKLHPDNGGNEEQFKEMQAEFTRMFDILKNVHTNKDGDKWEATGERATTETAREFMDVIEKLMFIPDITVELCGSWIWVGGNTKGHKELLKELHFRWSANKSMWYYHKEEGKRRYRKGNWSIDKIRDTFGSELYHEERERIATA